MRKHRRQIKRRTKEKRKNKIRRRKGFISRHLDANCNNRWTKVTTYLLIIFEFVFVLWWLQDLLLNWTELVAKIKNLFGG